MASDEEHISPSLLRAAALFRLPRRRSPASTPRRRRMPTVRLGGGARRRWWRHGRRILLGALRRIKLRWLKTHYAKALQRLRAYYADLVKELIEGSADPEAVRARIMAETSFAVPIMPITLTAANHCRYYR